MKRSKADQELLEDQCEIDLRAYRRAQAEKRATETGRDVRYQYEWTDGGVTRTITATARPRGAV